MELVRRVHRNIDMLAGVNQPLPAIFIRAMMASYEQDYILPVITDSLRSRERQQELVMRGVSWTLESKHITGDAIDIALFLEGDELTWDFAHYKRFASHMKVAAKIVGADLTWGGDWKQRDGTHFQL